MFAFEIQLQLITTFDRRKVLQRDMQTLVILKTTIVIEMTDQVNSPLPDILA